MKPSFPKFAPFFFILVLLFLPAMLLGREETTAVAYPIVDSGQDTCSDSSSLTPCPASGAAFAGQDAQHQGRQPDYTDHGDGTVGDNVTGLMWQKSPDTDNDGDIDAADKLTDAAAASYCQTLTLAGYDDWRLPDIKQLYSLIDFRGTDPGPGIAPETVTPFLDAAVFDFAYGDVAAGERLIDAQYASGTAYVSPVMNGRSAIFGVNFGDGRIKGYPTEAPPPRNEAVYLPLIQVPAQ
jgi:hypothetical protein